MTEQPSQNLLRNIEPALLEKFVNLQRRNIASYSIISLDPPIFYVARYLSEIAHFTDSFRILFDHLKMRRAYFLYAHDSPFSFVDAKAIADLEAEHRREYPNFSFVHLCNHEKQIGLFNQLGLTTILCNHNAMVDEGIFRPLSNAVKSYDAVYDARLVRFKRHWLASKLESIGLIYYSVPTKDEADCMREIKKIFSHARFFNHSESGEYRVLDPAEVNESLNQCRVGLCLSEGDGAQYASIQYLLAGLPVVETESQGGRDVFFDPEYSIRVEPTPEAVKNGVEEMIRRRVAPEYIRHKTIEKMMIHRLNFISLIQGIYEQEGIDRDFSDEWKGVFFNRLVRNQHHVETIELLKRKVEGAEGLTNP